MQIRLFILSPSAMSREGFPAQVTPAGDSGSVFNTDIETAIINSIRSHHGTEFIFSIKKTNSERECQLGFLFMGESPCADVTLPSKDVPQSDKQIVPLTAKSIAEDLKTTSVRFPRRLFHVLHAGN